MFENCRPESQQDIACVAAQRWGDPQRGVSSPRGCDGSNPVELLVYEYGGQILLIARLDNPGKGPSRTAVQNIDCPADLTREKRNE